LFIAYFQAFSNTHAPAERLREIFEPVLAFDELVALSIATRPDCLDQARLDLLAELNRRKEIWLELGLQSAHDETLRRINRGHDFAAFVRAAEGAAARGLAVFVHLILGLPGEGLDQARETVRRLSTLKLAGVKFHGLYVSSDAPLAADFRAGRVRLLGLEEYADWIADLIPRLPAGWVIQRLTADPNHRTLLGPEWMLRKPQVLAAIHQRLEERDVRQGQLFRT
ncbi:MAG: TIGR01212 family radical SAM protein, partial [Thermodesulfobacteriota bacterium]